MAESERSLSGITLLEGLGRDELAALEKKCRWRRIRPRRQIIARDAESTDVYFVVRGSVRVVDYAPSGREISFVDIGAGGMFGELAAIDGEPRSAGVVALEKTTVASLSRAFFLDLATGSPAVALAMLRHLAGTLRAATGRIFDLSTLGAHNRIHAELLRLAKPGPEEQNTAVIRPIPVHGDIASRVSTTRETVARALGELGRRGLVRREGDTLIVQDLRVFIGMVKDFKG